VCSCCQSVWFTVQQYVTVEVGVKNPTETELMLEVTLEGHGLTGASTFVLAAQAREVYQATFAPTAVGQYEGR